MSFKPFCLKLVVIFAVLIVTLSGGKLFAQSSKCENPGGVTQSDIVNDFPIDEYYFVHDDFEAESIATLTWTYTYGEASLREYADIAPTVYETYYPNASGSIVLDTFTNNETSSSTIFMGKCHQPIPKNGEKIFVEGSINRLSTEYEAGEGVDASTIGLGFSSGMPGEATQSVSLIISSLDIDPNLVMISVVYTRFGMESPIIDYLLRTPDPDDPYMFPFFHVVDLDKWHHFKIIYESDTGHVKVYHDGERIPSMRDYVGYPLDFSGAFNRLPYKAFIAQNSNRLFSQQHILFDNINSNITILCDHEIPPEFTDISPLPCDRCEYTEIVGSSVKVSSGEFTETISLPSIGVMGTRFGPSFIYNNITATPTVSIASKAQFDLEEGRRPDTLTWHFDVDKGVALSGTSSHTVKDIKYHLSPTGEQYQKLNWKPNDTYEYPLTSETHVYKMLASTDYDQHTIRLVSPVSGRSTITNHQRQRLGRGWAISGVEKLNFNEDGSIQNIIGNNRTRIYAPGGKLDNNVFRGLKDTTDMKFSDGEMILCSSSGEIATANLSSYPNSLNVIGYATDSQGLEVYNGSIYVTQGESDQMCKMPLGGGPCDPFIHFLDSPKSIALSSKGHLIVQNRDSGIITDYDPEDPENEDSHHDIASFIKNSSRMINFEDDLTNEQNLWVSHDDVKDVHKISTINQHSGEMRSVTMLPFERADGMALSNDRHAFVSSTESGSILRISPDGVIDNYFKGIESPGPIASDDSGNIYVADSSSENIYKLLPGKVWYPSDGSYSQIDKTPDGYLKTTKDGMRLVFNFSGRHLYTEDPNGNRITYEYLDNHDDPTQIEPISAIIDPAGKRWNFHYGNGVLQSISDPENRVTNFVYSHILSHNPVLTEVHYPDLSVESFQYDDGLMISKIDALGNKTEYQYNNYGRFAKAVAPIPDVDNTISSADSKDLINEFDACDIGTLENPAEPIPYLAPSDYENENGFFFQFKTNRFGNITNCLNPIKQEISIERDQNSNPTSITYPDKLMKVDQQFDRLGNPLSTELIELEAVVQREFEPKFSQMTVYKDPNGNMTKFNYDPINGNLDSISDAMNNTSNILYTDSGQVDTFTNPLGYASKYYYSTDTLNPIRVEMPTGASITYTYDNFGNIRTTTDPLGYTTSYQYATDTNRVSLVTDPFGHSTQYSYDAAGHIIEILDKRGAITHYSYDKMGYLKTIEDALGNTTTYGYDACHNLTSITDPRGATTHYTYDPANRLMAIRRPEGVNTFFAYDDLNRIERVVDGNGNATGYSYLFCVAEQCVDKKRHLKVKVATPNGLITDYEYDKAGNLYAIHQIKSGFEDYIERRFYNMNNQLEHIYRPLDSSSEYRYDQAGNLTHIFDSKGQEKRFYYDEMNRVRSDTDEMGNGSAYEYDLAGNRILIRNANGILTRFNYDALGRATSTHYAENINVNYSYDENGNLLSITDGNGQSTLHSYDVLGRIEHSTDSLGFVTSYKYDSNGNTTMVFKKDGTLLQFEYDLLNRLKEKKYTEFDFISYIYDLNSNLTNANHSDTDQVVFSYDPMNNVLSAHYEYLTSSATSPPTYDLSYEWDHRGNLISFEDIAHYTYEYDYDLLSRIIQMEIPNVESPATWEYDTLGQITSFTAPNNAVTTYGYDPTGKLLNQSTSVKGSVLAQFGFAYDNIGNRTSMTDWFGVHNFAYDDLSRLNQAMHPERISAMLPDETYEYDNNHNRVASITSRLWDNSTSQAATVSYSYDQGSRLEQDSIYNYEYDPSGNLRLKASRDGTLSIEYDYDFDDRLIAVREWRSFVSRVPVETSATPTLTATYAYDPLGRRTSKSVNGVVTHYAWDGDNLVGEYNAGRTLIARYIHIPEVLDHPIAMERGGQTFYYMYNGSGSVASITNSDGQEVYRITYDSFGRPVPLADNLSNAFTYTGRQWDPETGLYFYRARAYDPETGRFLQQDPVWSTNLYAYANNNPTNLADPYGRWGIPIPSWLTELGNPKTYTNVLSDWWNSDINPHLSKTLDKLHKMNYESYQFNIEKEKVVKKSGISTTNYSCAGSSAPFFCQMASDPHASYAAAEFEISNVPRTKGQGILALGATCLVVGDYAERSLLNDIDLSNMKIDLAYPSIGFNDIESFVDVNSTARKASTTLQGVIRDPRKYWRERIADNAEDLSVENIRRIKKRLSPMVDDQWIEFHPNNSFFNGHKIEIHHFQGGEETVELPWGMHGASIWDRVWHPWKYFKK